MPYYNVIHPANPDSIVCFQSNDIWDVLRDAQKQGFVYLFDERSRKSVFIGAHFLKGSVIKEMEVLPKAVHPDICPM